ncbi:MAG: 3' terminal RNA ribose 2'-O-methyltransferase Hen1 [Actinomycetota bacterium]|nr:3' terminal RNA ribose 2'-O-methyltransferase Hen1 [Actinomycetota bacterium]
MLLTLTTTHKPATDLGYLLHKNPARPQVFDASFGKVYVFYPEATEERCTAAMLLDVDPVGLVRKPKGAGATLDQYVNDRPYAASSFLSVAISRIYGSALGGRSKEKPDLVDAAIPLEAHLPSLPCRGGESFLRELFEPLGYEVQADAHLLDPRFPDWGESPYYSVALQAETRLQDLLGHLYVLVPVLDNSKHYWVSQDEIDKLLRHGEGWLASHPAKNAIVRRYFKRRWSLAREALSKLVEEEEPNLEEEEEARATEEAVVEERISLNEARLGSVMAALRFSGARRVLDLGCGEGKLLQLLLKESQFEEIAGMDISLRSLDIAENRLHLDRLAPRHRERIKLLHGSLMYRDRRLEGYDAAAVVEVIEHLDQPRLAAFERVVFDFAKPGSVVVTTPNSEYNVRFETLPAGTFRHRDHRFEWTREEFQAWSGSVAERFGYSVRFVPVGPEDQEVGPPTQMAVFTR